MRGSNLHQTVPEQKKPSASPKAGSPAGTTSPKPKASLAFSTNVPGAFALPDMRLESSF